MKCLLFENTGLIKSLIVITVNFRKSAILIQIIACILNELPLNGTERTVIINFYRNAH